MTTPAEQPIPEQFTPEMTGRPIYFSLDDFRASLNAWDYNPNHSPDNMPGLSIANLSEEDRSKLNTWDIARLDDATLLGTESAAIQQLPPRTILEFREAQVDRAERLNRYSKTKWVREFLEDNPEVVRNFPPEAADALSWSRRRVLEKLQAGKGRPRGHLALVGAEVEEPEVPATSEALEMPWDEEPEEPTVNRFAAMTKEQLDAMTASGETGWFNETETKQFSNRRLELRDRAKLARIEAAKLRNSKLKPAEQKAAPESDADDAEKTGFGKFWSGVTKAARQFKPSEIAATGREMRSFTDSNSGTPEGEESSFATPEWQAHAAARQAKIAKEKAPEIKGKPEKPGVDWEVDLRRHEPEWPGLLGMDKLLKGIERGEINIDLTKAQEMAKKIFAASTSKVWVYAVRPVIKGIGKVNQATYNWVTEPDIKGGERKIRAARAAALGLFAVSGAALTIGVVDVLNDPDNAERAQQTAAGATDPSNSAAPTGTRASEMVTTTPPKPSSAAPVIPPVSSSASSTIVETTTTQAPKPPTKAPEFGTPGVDTVEPQAPKAPETPQAPGEFGTPGVDTIPGAEAVGSGDVLPQDSNIWDYSSNLLEQNGYKGTDAEVAALKNWMLPQTGFDEYTDHLMPTGFPMPKVSVEDLKNILGH